MIRLTIPFVALAVSLTLPSSASQDTPASKAGKHCLSDFAKKRFGHLRLDARRSQNFETRLFAAYLLYKQAPGRNRVIFIKALPKNRDQFSRYSKIPYTLNPIPGAEASEVRVPSLPWPLNFWDIHKLIFELAVAGEPEAISTLLGLSGYGDGEFAEGIGDDCTQLFLNPDLVASHWPLFEPYIDFVSELDRDLDPEEILALRNRYILAFKDNSNGLKAILYEFEHSKR